MATWLDGIAIVFALVAWMAMLALPGKARRWEPKRLRLRLFSPAGHLVRGGRRIRLRLAERWPPPGVTAGPPGVAPFRVVAACDCGYLLWRPRVLSSGFADGKDGVTDYGLALRRQRPGVANGTADPFPELLVGLQVVRADAQPAPHLPATHARHGGSCRLDQSGVRQHRKIEAIKRYRELNPTIGLKQAKT